MTKAKSLKFRLSVVASATVGVGILIYFASITAQSLPKERNTLVTNTKAAAELSTKNIVENYLAFNDTIDQRLSGSMRPIAKALLDVPYYQVIETSGDVVYDSRTIKRSVVKEKVTDEQTLKALQANQASDVITKGTYAIIMPYAAADGSHIYSVRYYVDFARLASVWKSSLLNAVIVLIILCPLTYFLFRWLADKFIAKPIDQIRSDTNVIAGGDSAHRVKEDIGGEFDLVVDNINNMVDKLTKSIQELEEEKRWKNEFIVLASHNLRTPLSIITSAANSLKHSKDSKDGAKFTDIILTRTKQLHALTENLLSISMLKGGKMKLTADLFDLLGVITSIAKEYESRMSDHKISFDVDSKVEKLIVKANQDQMFQVLDNLIDNAIKFTPEGGKVTVTVEDTGAAAVVTVSDTGKGMEEETLNKLFQSFHRGSSPASMENEGVGLGLYFVKLAIEAQGGEVAIRSEEGKGTHVTFRLPKAG